MVAIDKGFKFGLPLPNAAVLSGNFSMSFICYSYRKITTGLTQMKRFENKQNHYFFLYIVYT